MPLITCPDCAKEVSTAAPACPHCGRPAQTPIAFSPSTPPKDKLQPSLFARVPKTLWAVLAAGVAGFVLVAIVGKDKATGNPLIDPLLNGLVGALMACAVAAYIAAVIICGIKGKIFFFVLGILSFGMPAICFWPIIGAIRIAKPDSAWALKYYDDQKMQIARTRFTKKLKPSS